MTGTKKIYFASDMHFGVPGRDDSATRERKFVQWLDRIAGDAGELFLLGDVFDFWFEYKKVVPKGFVRVLGKLAELSDRGISLHFFTGNHDLWIRDYLTVETGMHLYRSPQVFERHGKRFLIGHGDGLGPGDPGYKFMKSIFVNPVAQWMFRWLHPDAGVALAQYLSRKNKYISGEETPWRGEEEAIIKYCRTYASGERIDFFVFGHRHTPVIYPLDAQGIYVNTGDWLHAYSYAVFDGRDISLHTWE